MLENRARREEDRLAVGREAEDDVGRRVPGQALGHAAAGRDDVDVDVAVVLAAEGDQAPRRARRRDRIPSRRPRSAAGRSGPRGRPSRGRWHRRRRSRSAETAGRVSILVSVVSTAASRRARREQGRRTRVRSRPGGFLHDGLLGAGSMPRLYVRPAATSKCFYEGTMSTFLNLFRFAENRNVPISFAH